MRLPVLAITILFLFPLNLILAQELSFEEYNPQSTLVVPGELILRAKFPFIDVHGHQRNMPDQDLGPVIAAMDTLNMGIMVNLSGRSGEQLKKSVKNISDHYPNRFVVFANVDFEGVGKENWTEMIKDFYLPFHDRVEHVVDNAERAKGERLLGVDPAWYHLNNSSH